MDIEKDFIDMSAHTSLGEIHVKAHESEGKQIVFLHGLGSSTRTWTTLVPFLNPNNGIYLIDMLGHGESAAPKLEYSVDIQVSVLRETIGELGLGIPSIFGHSYGGWIAAKYAISNEIDRLILEDSAGLPSQFGSLDDAEKERRKETILRNPILSSANQYVIKSILDREFTDVDALTNSELGMITAPTLIIWGSKDDILDPKQADAFFARISSSTLLMVKNARHTPHYTFPMEIAKAISNFVR